MIFIENKSFVFVILFVVAFNALRYFTPKKELLNLALLCGSILIIHVLSSIQSITVIVGVSSLTYFTGFYISRNPTKGKLIVSPVISLLVILFILKNYEITRISVVDRVGLSYILFRLISFLVDSSQNKIRDYDLFSFLNYILFFPTFLAGPIDRYQNFSDRSGFKIVLIRMGVFKLALGIIKKYLLVPQLAAYASDFSPFSDVMTWQHGLIASLIIYSFYILFDFSGYSDIAIGTAYLIGVRTPENFNWPYFAKNISAFWKKWHITFSNFLFDYLYKPLVIKLSDNYKKTPRLLISCIGYLVTFLACGVWHGNSLNFVFWGLWHAVGLCFYKLTKPYFIHFTNRFYKSLFNGFSVVITFLFVTIGWFFFNYKTDEIFAVTKSFFSSNEKKLSINSIKYLNKYGFKLKFAPNNKDSLIDIEFGTASRPLKTFNSLKRNNSGEYLIVPSELNKQLYVINARSKSKDHTSEWQTQIVYFDILHKKPNFIQRKLFGNKVKPDSLMDENLILFEDRLELPSKLANQKIEVKANYFDNNYGWGIRIFYLPDFLYLVDIEYRHESSEIWRIGQSERPGKYNFGDIHGNLPFGGTIRNLAPGKYFIRIRYVDELKRSIWFEGSAIIPNYSNGQLQ